MVAFSKQSRRKPFVESSGPHEKRFLAANLMPGFSSKYT